MNVAQPCILHHTFETDILVQPTSMPVSLVGYVATPRLSKQGKRRNTRLVMKLKNHLLHRRFSQILSSLSVLFLFYSNTWFSMPIFPLEWLACDLICTDEASKAWTVIIQQSSDDGELRHPYLYTEGLKLNEEKAQEKFIQCNNFDFFAFGRCLFPKPEDREASKMITDLVLRIAETAMFENVFLKSSTGCHFDLYLLLV